MKNFPFNHYERAFRNWLIDNQIAHIAVDEHKRAAFGRSKIKGFDFLLYRPDRSVVITEVKGRKFRGASFEKLSGFDCWVTADDVESLSRWSEVFGRGHRAVFVFAYRVEKIDVDFDGREVYDFDEGRYAFFAVGLDDYRNFMKLRSPKWRTVTLPAAKFRKCAQPISELLHSSV